jgi:hypothetical protein
MKASHSKIIYMTSLCSGYRGLFHADHSHTYMYSAEVEVKIDGVIPSLYCMFPRHGI